MIHPSQWFHHRRLQGEHGVKERVQRLLHNDVLWIIIAMVLFLVAVTALSFFFGRSGSVEVPYMPYLPY
jgi:hypothetical protein